MSFNPKIIYRDLESAYFEIQARVQEATGESRILFTAFCGYGWDGKPDLHFNMECKSVKVEGKDLAEMTDELIRRVGFESRQKVLAIGSSTVEGSIYTPAAAAPSSLPADDEIPF